MTKYVFVTGGVVSGLGKGIVMASLGRLLKARGLKVAAQKLDPYINVDPGTMSPYQHGEVFVTEDGAETDLDLGHYERFIDENLNRYSNLTTGKVYWDVLNRERRGEFLGETVQIIPHITGAIKDYIYAVGKKTDADVVMTEIGGTIGDIESQPFLEAVRQIGREAGRENCLYVHVTLVPYIASSGEQKTKPTQHSVKELLTSDSTGARMLKTVIANHFDISPDELDKFAVVEYMLDILVGMMNETLGSSLSADSIMTLLNSGYETALQELGGADDEGFHMPTGIYIYPTTFDTKDTICAFLDSWNDANPSAAVTYTDYAGTISTLLSMVVDIVSYILIAFAAISLVVSSVMIAIITYVSVLERTTEIGVLRSIGARKLDISNLFNAETAIIGATAGVLGVFIAWILDFPINYWISTLATQAPSDFAVLNPLHALLLVALSIFLTVLSGLIPAIAAAKKDPVKALRASG